jgi:hypothetical protein
VTDPPPLPQSSPKRILPALVLCILLCAHRIYAGKIISGIVQIACAMGTFLWTLKAAGGLLEIVCSGPVTFETVERVAEWQQTHGTPILPMLAFVAAGIWIAVDAGLLLAGKFTDGRGNKITRWV